MQRLQLKYLSKHDTLRTLMHNSAVWLENSDNSTSSGPNIQAGIVLPATVMNDATAAEGAGSYARSGKKWKSFSAGMFTML